MIDVSGIYLIRNQINVKVYVGQSIHIWRRWYEHKKSAKRGDKSHLYEHKKSAKRGDKSHLYDAIRKYSVEAFTHELFEECQPELFDEREAYWMTHYDCRNPNKGYNLMPAGQRGRVMDDDCRERIASKLRGRKRDPEVVRRIAEKARGKKHSDETKQKFPQRTKVGRLMPRVLLNRSRR